MLMFVIYVIGIYILYRLAIFNLALVAAIFENNSFFGFVIGAASICGWVLLLGKLFG